MATSPSSVLGTSVVPSDSCFPIAFTVFTTNSFVSPTWLAVAIVFGFLLGSLLGFLLWHFCYRRRFERRPDKNKLLDPDFTSVWRYLCVAFCPWCADKKSTVYPSPPEPPYQRIVDGPIEPDVSPVGYDDDVLFGDDEPLFDDIQSRSESVQAGDGMVDILLQDTQEQAELEKAKQAARHVDTLETDVVSLRNEIAERLAQIHLLRFAGRMDKGDKAALTGLFQNLQLYVREAVRDYEDEYKSQLEAISKSNEYKAGDPKLKEEVDKLRVVYKRRLHNVFKESMGFLQDSLSKIDMDKEDAKLIMSRLQESLGSLEELVSDLVDQKAQLMEQRGVLREYLLNQFRMRDAELDSQLADYLKAADGMLTECAQNGNITVNAKQQLGQEFSANLKELKEKHRTAVKHQQEQAALKLRQQRRQRLDELEQKHEQQLARFLNQAPDTDPRQFLEKLQHELKEHMAVDEADILEDMDKQEAQKLHQIYDKLNDIFERDLDESIARFVGDVGAAANLSDNEVKKLRQRLRDELKSAESQRKKNNDASLKTLKTQMEENQQKVKEEMHRRELERQQILQQQRNFINQTLDSQSILDDEARKQILQQHETDLQNLNSVIALTMMKQQKGLEQKLAERRAKVANLQRQVEQSENSDATNIDKRAIVKQYELELSKLGKEQQLLPTEMRNRLWKEVQFALEEQDAELAELMARLQVGCLRRQKIIEKQEKAIKRLEESLRKRETQSAIKADMKDISGLLKEHRESVQKLNNRLQQDKEKQIKALQERIEAKRKQQQTQLDTELEKQEQKLIKSSQNNKMNYTESLTVQDMLDRRRDREINELEQNIRNEMRRKKEQLNKDLQRDLQSTLEEQKKQFLERLSRLCDGEKVSTNGKVKHTAESKTDDMFDDEPQPAPVSKSNTNKLPPLVFGTTSSAKDAVKQNPRHSALIAAPAPHYGRLPPIERPHDSGNNHP